MRKTAWRLILRRSIRIVLISALLMASKLAVANNSCASLFIPESMRLLLPSNVPAGTPLSPSHATFLTDKGVSTDGLSYLGGGSEGEVFVNSREQTALKFFRNEYHFKHSLWMENRLTESALRAGYKVATSSKTDPDHLMIEHRLEGGLTLQKFSREFIRRDPKKWYAAFDQYRIIFAKFRKLLLQDPTFRDDSDMSGRGYFDHPDGHFTHDGKTYYLNLHEENVLITETSPGKFEFTIIDWE